MLWQCGPIHTVYKYCTTVYKYCTQHVRDWFAWQENGTGPAMLPLGTTVRCRPTTKWCYWCIRRCCRWKWKDWTRRRRGQEEEDKQELQLEKAVWGRKQFDHVLHDDAYGNKLYHQSHQWPRAWIDVDWHKLRPCPTWSPTSRRSLEQMIPGALQNLM